MSEADRAVVAGAALTITSGGRTVEGVHEEGESILGAALRLGLKPAYSCLSGSCASCLARVTTGSVWMENNDVLSDAELAEGYVLTCQSLPTAGEVVVVYEE